MSAATGFPKHKGLDALFDHFDQQPQTVVLRHRLQAIQPDQGHEPLSSLYREAIGWVEKMLENDPVDETLVTLYQQLFRELEAIIASTGSDRRHKFIIIIPVADRPQHLRSCLDSLLTLCQRFHYGGHVKSRFPKVCALIADDSKEASNIQAHQRLGQEFSGRGLEVTYFGQTEQLAEIDRLTAADKARLSRIIGQIDRTRFYHKGASIMRNITYLRLNRLKGSEEPLLFYFIDSDQEFRVKIEADGRDCDRYSINYLYYLDQIFSSGKTRILTGKVVGDPPVSPSVMAGNFLEDVIGFLTRMSLVDKASSCEFHNNRTEKADGASYHDMADLFGFKPADDSFRYQCTLSGAHDHLSCFKDFARKLNGFFDGEHPTRKTYYEPEALFDSIQPARTIYTGNYIFRPEALDFFIPFAALKLRMAGPVLGRLIQAEIEGQFVSANLPMLHKRTVHETGESEFRPGIQRASAQVDLSGEFERQFFGDVMLFSMEQLTAQGYPRQMPSPEQIAETVRGIADDMHQKYLAKQTQIALKLELLKSLFLDRNNWWNNSEELDEARDSFGSFIANMTFNFSREATGYRLINDPANRERRLNDICSAIGHYAEDRAAWHASLETAGASLEKAHNQR